MILFLFLLAIGVLFVIAAGFVVSQALSSYGGGFTIAKTVSSIVLFVVGVLFVFGASGLKEVGPGQVGVKTAFGEVQEGTLSPGLHWLMPMRDELVIFDGRVQAYNFEGISGATRDLQAVGLSGLINYHIDASKADVILQTIGGPDAYAAKVFLRPSNTALKEVTPRYSAAEVIGKRDEIGQTTLANLQTRMAPFNIIVDRVSVENISLAQQFLDSVEAKQIAQQDLEKAEFQAQTKVRQAEGERDARIAQAEGEATANDLINASLTDDLLQWAAIQRLTDKVKVMMVPSDQGFIFDLGNVLEETP